MIFMTLRMPIACLCITLYSIYHYRSAKHVAAETTRVFVLMMWCAAINLIADCVTELTMNYQDVFSPEVNYVWHTALVMSLFAFVILLYWYLLIYVENGQGRRRGRERLSVLIVFVVFETALLMAPVSYRISMGIWYAWGIKEVILYVGMVYCFIAMRIHLGLDRDFIPKKQYHTFHISSVMIITFTILEIIIPFTLLTGLCVTLVLIGLYMSMESPETYIDKESRLFNSAALKNILREKTLARRKMTIVAYAFNEKTENDEEINGILAGAARYMKNRYHSVVGYRLNRNIVVCVYDDFWKKGLAIKEENLPRLAAGNQNIVESRMIFNCPSDCETYQEVWGKVKEFREKNANEEMYLDKMTGVFNRNGYERDMPYVAKNYKQLWYIVVDINNLKYTNDRFGHSAGDNMITSVAQLLRGTFSCNGQVYRTGGDEFIVIYTGNNTIEYMLENLRKDCKKMNTHRSIPASFAIGYERYEAGKTKWADIVKQADENMYEDKKKCHNSRRNGA